MELEKIKLGLWGAALGAFALFGVGFGISGWVLGGTAQERVETALIDRLTGICIAQFHQDPMKDQKAKALNELPYSKRGEFVARHGWATMPGDAAPDSAVAEKCGDRLS